MKIGLAKAVRTVGNVVYALLGGGIDPTPVYLQSLYRNDIYRDLR